MRNTAISTTRTPVLQSLSTCLLFIASRMCWFLLSVCLAGTRRFINDAWVYRKQVASTFAHPRYLQRCVLIKLQSSHFQASEWLQHKLNFCVLEIVDKNININAFELIKRKKCYDSLRKIAKYYWNNISLHFNRCSCIHKYMEKTILLKFF